MLELAHRRHGSLAWASLFESAIALQAWETSGYFATGDVPERLGSAHRVSAPYQALRAAEIIAAA